LWSRDEFVGAAALELGNGSCAAVDTLLAGLRVAIVVDRPELSGVTSWARLQGNARRFFRRRVWPLDV